MNLTELIKALKRLKVETGSLACMGCGCEHNCSTQGCAIIRAAVERLEREQWIPVEDDNRPAPFDVVWVSVLTKNGYDEPTRIEELGCFAHGEWNTLHGLADGERITHWMPLPEGPEEA